MEQFLSKFFSAYNLANDGSLFMWAIALMGAWGLVIIVERFNTIWMKANVNAKAFMTEIYQYLRSNNVDAAIKLCSEGEQKALVKVVGAILKAYKQHGDYRAMQNAADEAVLEIVPHLNKRTPMLQMISGVSTLLGLIGTIYGLIIAFSAAAAAGAGGSQALTVGISVAMLTTFAGLMNAIPISLLHAVIQSKTNHIIETIDENSVKLMNFLIAK
ncbi:MAG: MotA/TolQ/ExbB proton channel family protein [bacterium]|nr:MotA/TolQ/ExbB proton channel family protein [bacterium]